MSTQPQGWQDPRMTWQATDAPTAADFNRIEGNPSVIETGNRTVDPTQKPTGNIGSLRQFLDWFAAVLGAIIGGNWWDVPAITLKATKTHVDATAVGTHGSASLPTASTLMHRDANGRAQVASPAVAADIARKDTVDAVQTNLNNHTGAASGAHAAAAISYAGSTNLSATTVEAALDELDAEKAGLAQANTFSQRQVFAGGITDGDANADVSFLQALGLAIDTRSWTATTWDATFTNLPKHIDIKDGATVVGTINLTYNSSGKPTQMVVAAGGKTVTYTITYNNGTQFASRTKAVV